MEKKENQDNNCECNQKDCECQQGETPCECNDEKCDCGEDCDCQQGETPCECNDEKCECNDDCDCGCNEEDSSCECNCEDCGCNEEETPDKLNEAYNKISELEDLLIRSRAELINYRKRKDEEISKMLLYSNEDLIIEILPTIDNIERAIKLDDENLTDELSKFLSGFKMIYCNLTSMLETFDVKTIDEINIPFNPKYHQAVLTDKIDNKEPGIVIEILQKGYILKDKVIRPAMVKVSE